MISDVTVGRLGAAQVGVKLRGVDRSTFDSEDLGVQSIVRGEQLQGLGNLANVVAMTRVDVESRRKFGHQGIATTFSVESDGGCSEFGVVGVGVDRRTEMVGEELMTETDAERWRASRENGFE